MYSQKMEFSFDKGKIGFKKKLVWNNISKIRPIAELLDVGTI